MSRILERTSAEWNAPVYRPGLTNHLESYFIKGNDPETRRAYWIKFTVYAPIGDPERAVGEVWAVAFDTPANTVTAAKQTFPIATCRLEPGAIEIGVCRLWQSGSEGRLVSPDGVPIAWRLDYDADSCPLVPFPWAWMYKARLPKSKTVTPHPDVRHRGQISVGDAVWTLRDVPGMQGHNWGREHAYRYAWMHCNLFGPEDAGTVFEGFSARVRVGGYVTPPLSGAVLWLADGRRLAFNRWRAMCSSQIRITHCAYRFVLENEAYRLEGAADAEATAMAGLVYRNPDGTVSNCLNSKTANLELRLTGSDGEDLHLKSNRAAALETLTRDDDHPVRMLV